MHRDALFAYWSARVIGDASGLERTAVVTANNRIKEKRFISDIKAEVTEPLALLFNNLINRLLLQEI